jgi:hypothetical protein
VHQQEHHAENGSVNALVHGRRDSYRRRGRG